MLLAVIVAAALTVPPLGGRSISTSHEARFALLARDIVERGAWFEPRVGSEVYRNKPPLYPWSIAALSLLRGRVSEATAQAPVVAAAVGAVLFTFLLGAALFGARAGLWGALILLTSYDFFAHSQLLLPDMLVVAFVTAAAYFFWRAQDDPPGRGALAAFYGALAMGVFAKGPVGLLPLLVAAVWLWSEHGPGGLRRLWSPLGIGLFAGVTAVWLAPFLAIGSRSFALDVLQADWLDWFVGFPSRGDLKDLAIEGLLGFMPWALVVPLALWTGLRDRQTPAIRFVLFWFLVPLLLITLSSNPRARYLLPIHPAGALLIAWWAETHGATRATAGRLLGWTALAGALVAIGTSAWLRPSPAYFAPGFSWTALPLAAGAIMIGIALFWGVRAGRPALLVYGAVGGMALILGYGVWPYNAWVNETQDFRRVASTLAEHARGTDAAMFVNRRFFQVDFYAGREIRQIRTAHELNEYLTRPERPVVLVNGSYWQEQREKFPPEVRILDEIRAGTERMLIVRLSKG